LKQAIVRDGAIETGKALRALGFKVRWELIELNPDAGPDDPPTKQTRIVDTLIAVQEDRRDRRHAAIVVVDQMRKATRVAASTTVASERSRSPVSAGAVSRLASSGSLPASVSSSSPRTAITRRRTYRT
jgi:hypothetical protein